MKLALSGPARLSHHHLSLRAAVMTLAETRIARPAAREPNTSRCLPDFIGLAPPGRGHTSSQRKLPSIRHKFWTCLRPLLTGPGLLGAGGLSFQLPLLAADHDLAPEEEQHHEHDGGRHRRRAEPEGL